MEVIDILRNTWFFLIGILLLGYSILDGFDLGIGMLFPILGKEEREKRILLNAIWPFWDGNEVWLLTAGGALFAAFPHAYATVFSGFYLALMLVLFALIFRAVSIEFWYYDEGRRGLWKWSFVLGSFLPSLLFGVAIGNVLLGIPLNENMDFTGDFFTLLRPYPLVIGILGLCAILLQGGTYAVLKTEGTVQSRAREATRVLWIAFIILFVIAFFATLAYMPEILGRTWVWLSALVVLAAWVLMFNSLRREKNGVSFIMSSLIFVGLWGIVGASLHPLIVRASNLLYNSLSIYNASSSELTLKVMLLFALIGMPLVIAYTAFVYKVFKGKVRD
jgi:cytochrome d ubiquinol oxidase subunit II